MQRNSQLEYKALLDSLIVPGSRWLDIGCGISVIPTWIKDSIPFQHNLIARCKLVCGCDPADDRPHVAEINKFVGDCTPLPYADDSFTIVTANMVVEHVEDPVQFMDEVRRVLVPGGMFVLHTPNRHHPVMALASLLPNRFVRWFASRSDGRDEQDIFPTFYRMNSYSDFTSLSGFEATEIRCLPTGPLLHKIPLLRSAEAFFIRKGHLPFLRNLQSNWLAVLTKLDASESMTQQTTSDDGVDEYQNL